MDRIKRVGYVCIDDISIVPEPAAAPEKPADLTTQLLTERKYTFSAGVLFDSGEASLRPEAGPELEKPASKPRLHSNDEAARAESTRQPKKTQNVGGEVLCYIY